MVNMMKKIGRWIGLFIYFNVKAVIVLILIIPFLLLGALCSDIKEYSIKLAHWLLRK